MTYLDEDLNSNNSKNIYNNNNNNNNNINNGISVYDVESENSYRSNEDKDVNCDNSNSNNENIVCPPLDENVIVELNKIFNEIKSLKTVDQKKMSLGVIKFIHNGEHYIHCPIKHVNSNGKDVCFGVCNHFFSLVDNTKNRRKLSAHKFQYHYYGHAPNVKNVNIYLKTSLSVEEAINKMKKDEIKKNFPKIIKGLQCPNCLKMIPFKRRNKKQNINN